MRTQFATALLALAAPLHAIKITSPSKNDVVDPSEGVEVKWSTVNTDPSRANLVLVNMAAGNTPFNKDLGEIDLSTGSVVISEKDVPSNGGYQFNLESLDELNTGILAQSEQFEVKDSGNDSDTDDEDDKKSTSSNTATSTSAAATTSSVVKTATLTSTATFSDSTVTMTATTLTTAAASVSGSATEGADGDDGDDAAEPTTSESTAGAAPTGMAVQAGGLFALVAGVAAVMA